MKIWTSEHTFKYVGYINCVEIHVVITCLIWSYQ